MGTRTYPQFGRQSGVGYTGMLLIMSVCIFIGMFAFKVGPHYFENWTVTAVAEDLEQKPELLKQSRSKVYAHINNAYRTNNLWDLKAEDTIKLTRDKKRGYIVEVQYERRAKLFHNIDIVTSFDTTSDNEDGANGE